MNWSEIEKLPNEKTQILYLLWEKLLYANPMHVYSEVSSTKFNISLLKFVCCLSTIWLGRWLTIYNTEKIQNNRKDTK